LHYVIFPTNITDNKVTLICKLNCHSYEHTVSTEPSLFVWASVMYVHVYNSRLTYRLQGLHWFITKRLGLVYHKKRPAWFIIVMHITATITDVFTSFMTFKFKIIDMFTRSFSYKNARTCTWLYYSVEYVLHYFYLSNINLWLNEISLKSFRCTVKDYTARIYISVVLWDGLRSNYCNLPSLTWFFLFSEKDWEDIKKMPEHGTLQKDFRKAKYELFNRPA